MQIPRYIAVNYTIKQYKLDFIYSNGAHVNLPESFSTPNRLGQTAVTFARHAEKLHDDIPFWAV